MNGIPPPPSKQSFSELMKLLTKFSNSVEATVTGKPGNEDLMRECRQSYEQFKARISATHPRFRPFLASWNFRREGQENLKNWCMELVDEDDHVEEAIEKINKESPVTGSDKQMVISLNSEDELSSMGKKRLSMNLTEMREYLGRYVNSSPFKSILSSL